MDEAAGAGGPGDGDAADIPNGSGGHPDPVVEIVSDGDLILDVTFETSRATLKAARKASPKTFLPANSESLPKRRQRVGFRVHLATLRRQSKYFERLLGDTRFSEAKQIIEALKGLSLRNLSPARADPQDLPWVKITDDDQATKYANREGALGDMLRILHGKNIKTAPTTMIFVTTLAVLADRFDCAAAVSRVLTSIKFKWPVTQRKSVSAEDSGMSLSTESVLRQKILVSWLFRQPVRFQAATRELIMAGSRKWTSFPEEEEENEEGAAWWYLPDGLEQELQFRRECIMNAIASVQRHFIGLYTSRTRQCKLGYDSSAACDSYQLGEIFKFLTNKNLMFLVDFSPGSLNSIAETSLLHVDTILATLRQFPSYQIDKNHTNCGLRTRVMPIVDFIQALLSANSVPLSHVSWQSNRQAAAWLSEDKTSESMPFKFSRAVANDQRLRFEHALGAERFARDVFTAPSWNWTADADS